MTPISEIPQMRSAKFPTPGLCECSGCVLLVAGLVGSESVAVAGDVDDGAAVQEPVEHGGGDGGVAEDVSPGAGASVGGQDDAGLEVALGDDLVMVRWISGMAVAMSRAVPSASSHAAATATATSQRRAAHTTLSAAQRGTVTSSDASWRINSRASPESGAPAASAASSTQSVSSAPLMSASVTGWIEIWREMWCAIGLGFVVGVVVS